MIKMNWLVTRQNFGFYPKMGKSDKEPLTHPIQTTDWVAVLYNVLRWPGIVESINNDYLYISFMKPIGINKLTWPNIPEKDKILKKNILTRLENSPNRINKRIFFLAIE